MSDAPRVTILVPARNEESDIGRCLQAALAQDYERRSLEVVVVDGGSTDRTAEIANRHLEGSGIDWRVVHNEPGTTPCNLNAGLRAASGAVLCRVDARSIVPPDYVRRCVEVLTTRPDVVVTGGAQVAVAVSASPLSVGIARALNNRFLMGGARYRSGSASGPSDTVYLGAFRTDELRAAGGWNEFFETNQDYELNRRLARDGGIVWFDARLRVDYVPRQSLLALSRQYRRFGRWKVRYWRCTHERPQRRQIVPIAGPPAAAVIAALTLRRRGAFRRAVLAVGSVVALGTLEHAGAMRYRDVGMGPRAWAVLTTVIVGASWQVGLWKELLQAEFDR